MKKILLIVCAFALMSCNKSGEHVVGIKETPGVFIKYKDQQHKITEDGTLYIIKADSSGVLIVEPANLDDCRRILENHGKG